MTGPAQRNARAALDVARLSVSSLDTSRGAEDLAADLIDVWSALEAALRALVGSSVLSGQPLIREARQRQLINFDQANALADFQAVHDRVQDTAYHPSEADLESARLAFAKLDAGLLGEGGTGTLPGSPTSAIPQQRYESPPPSVAAAPMAESTVLTSSPRRRGLPVWAVATLGVLVLALIGGAAWFAMGTRGSSSLQQGVDAYRAGQREAAVSAFNKAVREDPKSALPHVYLGRMAREVGNFTVSNQELQLALQTEPSNPVALREMGSNLFAQSNYELARRFYVRAIQADPTDKTSQGYLGCALAKLGRPTEAASFLTRAGNGPWSTCASTTGAPTTPVPGVVR